VKSESRPLIAHVVHRLDVGGLENGLVNLVNRLPADRYRHAIVSLTDVTDFTDRIEREDVAVVSLAKRSGHDLGLHLRLYRTFRRLRPSIVHTRNLATVEAVLAAAAAGVPCRVHGEHGRDMQDPEGCRRRYRVLRRSLSPLIHRFIALSRDLERYLLATVGISSTKVLRITNGVDLDRFRPAVRKPDGLVTIGSVTRMQEVKDPLTLARAFILLARRGVDARLVLVGDGPLLDPARRMFEGASVSSRVTLAGSRSDVPEMLRSFDVFCLSSLVEGISNTILEAMATGLPVVATGVGGNAELVENGVTGALVPPRDPEALASVLARYVEEERLRREHGLAGRARVEREFGLDRMVGRYLGVYDELLSSGRTTELRGNPLRCAE
jgi:sugar transferase (PEP-CTERM/EpsH1 system associated)